MLPADFESGSVCAESIAGVERAVLLELAIAEAMPRPSRSERGARIRRSISVFRLLCRGTLAGRRTFQDVRDGKWTSGTDSGTNQASRHKDPGTTRADGGRSIAYPIRTALRSGPRGAAARVL